MMHGTRTILHEYLKEITDEKRDIFQKPIATLGIVTMLVQIYIVTL